MEIVPFQRNTGADPVAAARRIEQNRPLLAGTYKAPERLRLLTRIGDDYRAIEQYEQALEFSEAGLALARELANRRAEVANLLSLATTYQYLNRHEEAERFFRECLAVVKTHEVKDLEDYTYQHYGKCLVEMGRLDEAIACFERALVLRQAKGEPGLLESTNNALSAARRLKEGKE